jgi:hypothetical protein
MLHRVHLAWTGFELIALMVIGPDCIRPQHTFLGGVKTCKNTKRKHMIGFYFTVVLSNIYPLTMLRYNWNNVESGITHHNYHQRKLNWKDKKLFCIRFLMPQLQKWRKHIFCA